MEKESTKIILVDDHALFRKGLIGALGKNTDFPYEVVGEAKSGEEFFALIQSGCIPDLVFLDIMLPDITGVEIARKLKTELPETKIIMLSSEVSEELVEELLEIGIEAYLSKMSNEKDIQRAYFDVMNGCHFFGHSVTKMMYDIYRTKKNLQERDQTKSIQSAECDLTEREIDVIHLLCEGLQSKKIAEILNLSARTVESHRNNIFHKLGFCSIAELVKYAIKMGYTKL